MSGPGGRHPIGVVAERTGLTQEVLRVWERRYGVVTPARDAAGQRVYTDADVERLRLLRRATHGGRSIGSVVGLSTVELARLVQEDDAARAVEVAGPGAGLDERVEAALRHVRVLDAMALETLLRRAAARVGAGVFLEELAAPFMRRVGEEWHGGRLTPAHEHLATSVLQRVLLGMVSALSPSEDAAALVVCTLSGDRHEVGVMLAAATAAAEGWRVVYLGADLPARDVVTAAVTSDAEAVAVSIVFVESVETMAAELRLVRGGLPLSVPVLVGGPGAESVLAASPAGEFVHVPRLAGLQAALRRIWRDVPDAAHA
ncbi:MAG TPA: MerR family transcriptional regulator [Longimicrobiales bacterium]|nr:MerR family transcriptional regulator [Longimicrobiales bacterium]